MPHLHATLGATQGPAFRRAGVKTRLLQLPDALWDLRLGVDTFGFRPAVGEPGSPTFQVHYTPTPYALFFRILRRLEAGPDDVMIDFGCGMGRTVFAAASSGVRKAVGVEIDADLHDRAVRNARRSRLRGKAIEFVKGPAEDFAADEVTLIFMFHPFGAGTMGRVIAQVEQSLRTRPRHLRIAYLNPVHAEVLDRCTVLERFDHWPTRTRLNRNARYAVTFWRSRRTTD